MQLQDLKPGELFRPVDSNPHTCYLKLIGTGHKELAFTVNCKTWFVENLRHDTLVICIGKFSELL